MKLKILAPACALAVLVTTAPNAEAAASRVSVCHTEGNGTYHLIDVSEFAVPAHRRHGDALPTEPVPDDPNYVFGADCGLEELDTPVVMPGYSGLTEAAGVRYRGNSSGNEIYLGTPDLGTGSNRVEASYPDAYSNWQDGTYLVTFSFDGVDTITTTIDDLAGDLKTLTYQSGVDGPAFGCPVSDWNTMDINLVDRLTTGELAFNNVELDGYALGDFDDEGWKNWTVSAFDFSQPWTVMGDMVVQGWTGSETNKLQLVVGCHPDLD